MQPISKEEFIKILDRQQKSGLSIKDFRENESYIRSSFYYWKSKYGLSRSYNDHAGDSTLVGLSPIRVDLPSKKGAPSSGAVKNGHGGEITVTLPSGVQVSFKGGAQEMAMELLDQIFSSHVLP